MSRCPLLRFLALMLTLAGCAAPPKASEEPSSAPPDLAAIRDTIQAREREWSAAFRAGDATGIAALYTEDAVQVQAAGEGFRGRDAITKAMQAQFDTIAVSEREDITEEVFAAGDYVVEIGRYSHKGTSKAGNKDRSASGRYMVLWRRDSDGVWRLHRDIGSEAPAKP